MKKVLPILLLLCFGCKQAYVPPVHSTNAAFLVVEGFINNGQDSTYINLTHTFSLADTGQVTPELHAQLTVEGKDNSAYPLQEWGNGQYGATSLALNKTVQYRLHIKTSAGKEYVSDYLDLKTSPPIDSINWKRTGDGVQIYANSHDPQSASHYYRWDWQETWQFHSVYYTYLQWVNHQVLPLSPDPYYTCWSYAHSTSVLVDATTKLAQDEVYQYPLELIPSNSWLISVRYSILVKQYVLTSDAYNYWSDLQKNTEQIGSIFSPQPFASRGNIHNVADATEQVVGFLSAGTLQKQRIFIMPNQIPNWGIGSYDVCTLPTTILDSLEFYLGRGNNMPVNQIEQGPPGHYIYEYAASPCVDCRLTGSINPPPYW
ncbi:MAG TPA: DUF4249 domain-containing protein [Puia sp.]|jgi:hypothetical protein